MEKHNFELRIYVHIIYIYFFHGRCRAPGCFGVLYYYYLLLLLFWLPFSIVLRWWDGVGWDVNVHVHVTLMMSRWSWGGVGWDVNVHVHVTLMMLRGPRGWVGWDVNVHVHVTRMIFRWSCGGVGWGVVGWDVNVHVHVTLMMLIMLIMGCWLPKEAPTKKGTGDLVTHSSKL